MTQTLASPHSIAIALPRLGTIERWLLAIIFLELPIQVDTNFYYPGEPLFGTFAGINVSLMTFCVALLYVIRLPELLVVRSEERGFLARASWPTWMYFAASAASWIVAYDRFLASFYVLLLLQFFLLFVYLVRFVRDRETIIFLFTMLFAGLLIESVIMFALRVHNDSIELPLIQLRLETDPITRVAGTFVAPVAAAAYFSLLLAPALAFALTPVSRSQKMLAAAAFCAGSLALYLTLSRGGFITYGISVVIVYLACWQRQRIPLIIPAVVLIVVAALAIGKSELLPTRLLGEDEGSAAARTPLNQLAVSIIADHPFWGVGTNNFAFVGKWYAGTASLRDEWFQTVHNKYLLVWAETGLFGVLGFVILLMATLTRGWRAWRARDAVLSPLAIGLCAAFLGQMIHMGVDRFNNRSDEQLLWMTAALLTCMDNVLRKG